MSNPKNTPALPVKNEYNIAMNPEGTFYQPIRNGYTLICPYQSMLNVPKTAEEIAEESKGSIIDLNQQKPGFNPFSQIKQVPQSCSSACALLHTKPTPDGKGMRIHFGCTGHEVLVNLPKAVAKVEEAATDAEPAETPGLKAIKTDSDATAE